MGVYFHKTFLIEINKKMGDVKSAIWALNVFNVSKVLCSKGYVFVLYTFIKTTPLESYYSVSYLDETFQKLKLGEICKIKNI